MAIHAPIPVDPGHVADMFILIVSLIMAAVNG